MNTPFIIKLNRIICGCLWCGALIPDIRADIKANETLTQIYIAFLLISTCLYAVDLLIPWKSKYRYDESDSKRKEIHHVNGKI